MSSVAIVNGVGLSCVCITPFVSASLPLVGWGRGSLFSPHIGLVPA